MLLRVIIFFILVFLLLRGQILIYLVRVLGLLLIVAFLVLVERNVLRLVQIRKGPNTVGVYRVIQTVMDRVKLLLKEIVYVGSAQFIFFSISPVVCFILSILS
jgi:NADH:ubiquinone oxidoreductase subunit H